MFLLYRINIFENCTLYFIFHLNYLVKFEYPDGLFNTILKTQCLEEGTIAGNSSGHEEPGPRDSIEKTSEPKEVLKKKEISKLLITVMYMFFSKTR
jgi:hypothetical protein